MKSSRVAVIKCSGYSRETVYTSVRRGIDLLGGIGRFVQPGEKILLKPNILAGDSPEKAVTSHPSIVEGLIRECLRVGARVSFGDSPGTANPVNSAKKAGLLSLTEKYPVSFGDFEHGSKTAFSDGKMTEELFLADAVTRADGIISIPKMKSHALTRITGAVKNQLGCIPGFRKARLHVSHPDAMDFSRLLVDINRKIKPRLYVMDGILAMEGNGPRSGDPIPMNVILLSADPVALDAAFCSLVGCDPSIIPTNIAGEEAGLGTYQNIEYTGDPLSELINTGFKVIRKGVDGHDLLKHFTFLKNLLIPRPVIDGLLCTACGACIRSCPVPEKAVIFSGKGTAPIYNYSECIRCYCCQEMCPRGAISVKSPFIGKLYERNVSSRLTESQT
jgi:uncharacterized protein (DUF362 family)/ferredoxin